MPPPRPPASDSPVLPGARLTVGMGTAALHAADRSPPHGEALVDLAGISSPQPGRGREDRGRAQSSLDLRVSLRKLPQHSQPSPRTQNHSGGEQSPLAAGARKLSLRRGRRRPGASAPRDALRRAQNRPNPTAGAGAASESKRAVGSEGTFPSLGLAAAGALGLRKGGYQRPAKPLRQVFLLSSARRRARVLSRRRGMDSPEEPSPGEARAAAV